MNFSTQRLPRTAALFYHTLLQHLLDLTLHFLLVMGRYSSWWYTYCVISCGDMMIRQCGHTFNSYWYLDNNVFISLSTQQGISNCSALPCWGILVIYHVTTLYSSHTTFAFSLLLPVPQCFYFWWGLQDSTTMIDAEKCVSKIQGKCILMNEEYNRINEFIYH